MSTVIVNPAQTNIGMQEIRGMCVQTFKKNGNQSERGCGIGSGTAADGWRVKTVEANW